MNAPADHPHLQRAAIDGAVLLPVHLVRPNPWNRKVHEARLAEMAASVGLHGVLQPIIVRQVDNAQMAQEQGQPLYEIIAGERRWRASQLAGLGHVPALLRQMTDLEVIELMLIENLQREDLHPLDEADGYARLLRRDDGLQGFATVDELAVRFGKSRSYVFQRLKLRELQDEAARAAFLAGTLNASVALLIARLKPADQAVATRRILAGWGGAPLPFRETADYIQREFMLALDRATFKITDATLLPEAGSCRTCPKRAGANPDLFDDVKKGDTCTDAACYHAKEEAHRAAIKATAAEQGKAIIAGPAAKKAKPQAYGSMKGLLELDKVHLELGDKPLRKLLGKQCPEVLLFEDPHTKALVDVVREDEAVRVLKEAGVLRQAVMPGSSAAEREAQRKRKAEAAYRMALAQACLDNAQAYPREQLVQDLAVMLWGEMHHDKRQLLGKLLGWPPIKMHWQQGPGVTADQHIRALDDAQLARYLAAATVAGDVPVSSGADPKAKPEQLLRLAAAVGVDAAAVRQAQRQLAKATPDKTAAARARKKAAAPAPDGTTPETALAAALGKAQKATPAAAPADRFKPRTAVKYRNQATGETWTGRGLQPRWLKAALAAGGTLADYLVQQ